MPLYLKQSTASQEVPLGHFVDDTDGKTAETALSIANTDIKLWVAGATTLASKNSGGATHIAGGVYYCVLDATDTATLGSLVIFVAVSGALAVRVECVVLAANIYDSMIGGGDILDVSVTQLLGTAWLTPGTAGTPDVNVKLWNALATVELPLVPTTAGRKLDVSTGGEAGVDWANVGSPTTTVGLSGTTVKTATDIATLIDDLPTNAELATSQAAADDATLSAVAALSIPTANQNADALLDRAAGVETGWTMRQAVRVILAALVGKASGLATTTATFRNPGDSKDRIVATVDADGNRSAVTLDAS